jgi:Xaa-Pro dipeptidase
VKKEMERAGYLRFFPHHTGHAIGLFVSEPPYLLEDDETEIPSGATLAIEPGLYIPGLGSFRLEVNVVVFEEGCRILGNLPAELISVV